MWNTIIFLFLEFSRKAGFSLPISYAANCTIASKDFTCTTQKFAKVLLETTMPYVAKGIFHLFLMDDKANA
jgi:hypothetical protein